MQNRQPAPGEHESYARLNPAPHRPSFTELAMRFIAVVATVVVVMLVVGWIASTAVGVWS